VGRERNYNFEISFLRGLHKNLEIIHKVKGGWGQSEIKINLFKKIFLYKNNFFLRGGEDFES
jgi:hypothetical protein